MSNRLRNGLTIVMLVALTVSAFAAGYLARELRGPAADAGIAYAQQGMSLYGEAWNLVEGHFLGEMPSSTDVVYGAIRGSLDSLNDPYTMFIEPAVREVERETLQGSFGGIGAFISRSEETGDVVLEPIPGNPAEKAGILAGDVLLAVNGTAITPDMTVPQIVDMVKGEKGSRVTLTIRHPGETEPVDIVIVRDDILLPSVVHRILEADPTIGYVQLSRFSGESGAEIATALTDLKSQGATRFVLDLRQNGGGLRDAAVEVADHFLDEGPVVIVESQQDGERVYRSTNDTLVRTEPLVILIDGGTASASEIVAGALKDRGRALLVGSKTFGKGSVQLIFDLSDGSSVHVTSARWYTPNRQQLDGNGLEPDIPAEMTQEAIDSGRDPALEAAVEHLQSIP